MLVKNPQFEISAVSPAQYPDNDLPQIVLVGKSNVGKSSFINTMVNRKKLARTSSEPGKTRQINFYNMDDMFWNCSSLKKENVKISKNGGKIMDEILTNTELEMEQAIENFEKRGTKGINAACGKELIFTAEEWYNMSEKEKSDTLMNYRIAYLGNTMVNWCPQLGTVLANDEVSEGLSIRGGYPVEQKLMYQWCLRVSAYAQ